VRAAHAQRYFKTRPGQYAAGDIFLGLTVPVIRRLARQFSDADMKVVSRLLQSRYHEERLLALIILVGQ
jgi:hypothetical protein